MCQGQLEGLDPHPQPRIWPEEPPQRLATLGVGQAPKSPTRSPLSPTSTWSLQAPLPWRGKVPAMTGASLGGCPTFGTANGGCRSPLHVLPALGTIPGPRNVRPPPPPLVKPTWRPVIVLLLASALTHQPLLFLRHLVSQRVTTTVASSHLRCALWH